MRKLNECERSNVGPVVYWMSRDHRTKDNWALLYAQKKAMRYKVPLVVLFCFIPDFLQGTLRQYGFMLGGLKDVERELKEKDIPFIFLVGRPEDEIPRFLKKIHASILITDFSPLRTMRHWRQGVSNRINIPFFEVDAHNIVPCWNIILPQDYTIKMFRLKMRSLVPNFLKGFPRLQKQNIHLNLVVENASLDHILESIPINKDVSEVRWLQAGEYAAQKMFQRFLRQKIKEYEETKKYIEIDTEWKRMLLPYLHFGQLSIQRVVWAIVSASIHPRLKSYILSTLIIRREFSEYYCYHNPYYDSFYGFPQWARDTLSAHRNDPREHVYAPRVFEQGKTHDDVWNSIQNELVANGRISDINMEYWAKKILEWTSSPEDAMKIAIGILEKYSLSGWDPHGYMNIAKSIGGVHDVPSSREHKIFGKISYIKTGSIKEYAVSRKSK